MTSPLKPPTAVAFPRNTRRRRVLIIALGNLIVLSTLLVGCEIVARGIVWAWEIPTEFQPQPFQEFGQTDPVVWWHLRSNLDTWWHDVRLRTNREGFRDRRDTLNAGALRVYCLGDSSTFGWDVKESQMYTNLAESFVEEATGRPVDIVSTGVPGYTSYQCLQVLREQIARKKPDVVVVMASNNECRARNVGDRDRGRMLARKRSLHRWLGFSRIWVLLSRAPETLTRTWDLDPKPGRVANTTEEYRENLGELLREASSTGARVVFMNMPLRLKVTPIWKHFDPSTPQVDALLQRARDDGGQPDLAARWLQEAIELQPVQFAAHWQLAQLEQARGNVAKASAEFALAREGDWHPDAAKPSYNRTLDEFCKSEGVPMIDLDRAFRESGISDEELFLDHCHPSPAGHRIIARELSHTLQGMVKGRK